MCFSSLIIWGVSASPPSSSLAKPVSIRQPQNSFPGLLHCLMLTSGSLLRTTSHSPTLGRVRASLRFLRLDMPHRDNANPDAPHKQHRMTYSSQSFLSPHYLTWTASPGVVAGPFLTLPDWQSWFCQTFGITPPALEPYKGQLCSCLRQCLDADHLHTCTHHSGNWQAAHELLLTAVC